MEDTEGIAKIISDIDGALERIFNPMTSPEEKIQLQVQFDSFKSQPSSCLPVIFQILTPTITNSPSQYILWFAVSTLEEYIATKWYQLNAQEKLRIRQFSWDFLFNRNYIHTIPIFARNKLRKVIADIARIEWRYTSSSIATWSSFIKELEAFIMTDEINRIEGMALLAIVAEEFGREDALVFSHVKEKVKEQFINEVASTIYPMVMHTISACVTSLQQGNGSIHFDHVQSLLKSSCATIRHIVPYAGEVLLQLINIDEINALFTVISMGISIPNGQEITTAGLQCLGEILNARKTPGADHMGGFIQHVIGCYNSLLEYLLKANPSQEILYHTNESLNILATKHIHRFSQSSIIALLPTFLQLLLQFTTCQSDMEGLTSCLRTWDVFISYMDENSGNPNSECQILYRKALESLLFHLMERITFTSNRSQLDELDDEGAETNAALRPIGADDEKEENLWESYDPNASGSGTLTPSSSLQEFAQWAAAAPNAVEISEYSSFVVEILAVIRRISGIEGCALPAISRVAALTESAAEKLIISFSPQVMSSTYTTEVKDLVANCSILSILTSQLYMHHVDEGKLSGWTSLLLFLKLSEALMTNHDMLTHHLQQAYGEKISRIVLTSLEKEVFTCMRFQFACLPTMLGLAQGQVEQEELQQIMRRVVTVLLVPLNSPSNFPEPVLQNSMQLLVSVGTILTFDDLNNIPAMQQLQAMLAANKETRSSLLPLSIQAELYRSICNSIFNIAVKSSSLSRNFMQEQWWQAYSILLDPLISTCHGATQYITEHPDQLLRPEVMEPLHRICFTLSKLAQTVEMKQQALKLAFCQLIQPEIDGLVLCLRVYAEWIRTNATPNDVKIGLTVIHTILRLLSQVIQSIRKELPKELVAKVISTFIEIFQDNQLSNILQSQGTSALMVLCGFLNLLKLVVAEPTKVFADFLPQILSLCFGPLREAIFNHPESESVILNYFVALMHQILATQYKYFVISSWTDDGGRVKTAASEVAHAFFKSIFEALSGILSRDSKQLNAGDIHNAVGAPSTNGLHGSKAEGRGLDQQKQEMRSCALDRKILELLLDIEKQHSIFSYAGFQHDIRMGLLRTLLMNFVVKQEMDLVQEEVILVLHQLADVDFASFYQAFLPAFTQEIFSDEAMARAMAQGESDWKEMALQWSGQVDIPTFTSDVLAFKNDLRVLKAQK